MTGTAVDGARDDRAERLVAALGDWSEGGSGTLVERLVLALRHLIESGVIEDRSPLPPERSFAAALHVSRPVVTDTVAELRRLGLVESRQGSGTRVRPPARSGTPDGGFFEAVGAPGMINLAGSTPFDASHLPDVGVTTGDLVATSPPHGYEPQGLESLRADLAERLDHPHGADGIVVTTGAHQGLALLFDLLLERGDRVLVETHTYAGLATLAADARASLVPVERDADGPDPDDLARRLQRDRPALAVVVGGLHNPTGVLTLDDRQRAVADAFDGAAEGGRSVPLVLDSTYDELTFGGRASPAVPVDVDVHRVGSLSKLGWTGLRTGWVATDPATARRLAVHRAAHVDLGSPVGAQLLVQRILAADDPWIERRRRRLATIAGEVVQRLSAAIPGAEIVEPDGGLTVWLRLPVPDAVPFVRFLREEFGTAVLPGSLSRPDGGPDPHLRLCFDRPERLLDEALDRVAAAWRHFG